MIAKSGFFKKGQGATEYLVLLAVVLVIALVALALLGDVFGRSGDVKITSSQAYWSSVAPLSIIGASAYRSPSSTVHYPFIKIRNTGTDSIRLKGIIVQGTVLNTYYSPTSGHYQSMGQNIFIGAGQEICFGGSGTGCPYQIGFLPLAASGSSQSTFFDEITALSSICDSTGTGTMAVDELGFDYDVMVGGSSIPKRFIGSSALIAPCSVCSGSNCYSAWY